MSRNAPPGDMASATAQAQDMLRACNTPQRYKRRTCPCALWAPLCAGCPQKNDGDSDNDNTPALWLQLEV